MTDDFARARASFADSMIGRVMASTALAVGSAWANSAMAAVLLRLRGRIATASASSLTVHVAVAVAIAAAMQPALALAMPRTVTPALPWPAYMIVAAFAMVIALRSEAIVRAWNSSLLRHWIKR